MDFATIVFKAIEVIPRFVPKPKPPVIDYGPIISAVPKPTKAPAIEVEEIPVESTEVTKEEAAPIPVTEVKQEVATSCIACSRSHLSTVSGALSESLRFAREGGIKDSEVQRRLNLAEDEINIMERIDLAPDALANSPEQERDLANQYLPRIRKLRQDLGQIKSVEELEKTAGEASVLGQEFRLSHLQLQGVDLNPVMELAKKVQRGEISIEEAKVKLKELLPEEE
jgi:hypothetical protein